MPAHAVSEKLCIVIAPALDALALDAVALISGVLTSGTLARGAVTAADSALGASLLEVVSSSPQAPATVAMHAARSTDRRTILRA